jgi:anti-anti-sigma factor
MAESERGAGSAATTLYGEPGMDITTSSMGKIAVIKPSEDIRVRKIVNMRKVFDLYIGKQPYLVAIDLSRVQFIDSSGIGLLVNFGKRLHDKNGRLYLFNCGKELRELLDMMNIYDVVTMIKDTDELKAIGKG